MTRWLELVGLVVLAAALGSGPAAGQSDFVARACNGQEDVSLNDRLAFCNAIIVKPGVPPVALANAYNNRGGVYYYKGDLKRALTEYDRAIALNPKSSSAFNNRCWARAVVGMAREAVEDCTQALAIEPGVGNTHENRGFAYLKLAEYDYAVDDYQEALKLDGERADLLYGRGLARVRSGDVSGEADIEAAKKLNAKIVDEFKSYGLE
jgi:tetratricopeptide (TPR) repeat protein